MPLLAGHYYRCLNRFNFTRPKVYSREKIIVVELSCINWVVRDDYPFLILKFFSLNNKHQTMRLFITRVCLTLKQAQEIVNALYVEPAATKLRVSSRRDYIANLLIELLILPVGRPIEFTRDHTSFIFDFDSVEAKDTRLAILYEENQIPQHIAQIFLNAVSFGDFKNQLKQMLKYNWPETNKLAV